MWNPDGTLIDANAGEVHDGSAAVQTTGYPPTWPTGRPRRRRARPGGGGPADDPDRHRRRLPAGAGGAAEPAGRLRLQPPRHRRPERLEKHTLFLGPAERADVIVDFSAVPPGKTLILYNDAPGAGPGVRPALRLLHRRPGSDRRPAARRRPCRATAPTPGRSCSSGSQAGTPATPFNLAAPADRAAGGLRGRPSRARSCPRRPTTPRTARRHQPTRTRGSRTPP